MSLYNTNENNTMKLEMHLLSSNLTKSYMRLLYVSYLQIPVYQRDTTDFQ
jgi:hypothetical protein